MKTVITSLIDILKKVSGKDKLNWHIHGNDLTEIRDQLQGYIFRYNLDIKRIFIELWWTKQPQLQEIAVYLLPNMVTQPNGSNINLLNESFKHLNSMHISEAFAENLAAAFNGKYFNWLPYLETLITHPNIWVRCMVIQTLGFLSTVEKIGIPFFLLFLKRFMKEKNKSIQACLSWTLVSAAKSWAEPVEAFIRDFQKSPDKETIEIICKAALGMGSWTIPLLEDWMKSDNEAIALKAKSTLMFLYEHGNKI